MRLGTTLLTFGMSLALAAPSNSGGLQRKAQAAPPTSHMVAAFSLPQNGQQLVKHELVPGESLRDIAERYSVSVDAIARLNDLDPKRPLFWPGQQLKVWTQRPERAREKRLYVVGAKDTWETIAERFRIEAAALTKWNPQLGQPKKPKPKQPLQPKPGQQLTIWLEPEIAAELPAPNFTLKQVVTGAQSVGFPDSGVLRDGVPIPENPELYTVRRQNHAYGSTHAIEVLQRALAVFRARTGYAEEIVLGDMSQLGGGRYGPHKSHRTGRDIDLVLPMHTVREGSGYKRKLDFVTIWHMVRAFVETGEIRYVFLSRAQQGGLYKAAKACGATAAELDQIVQYPRTKKVGIVRDAPGHTAHMHVRFVCGPEEAECRER